MAIKNDKMTPSIDKILRKLDKLPQEAFDVFVKNTPIRSGNARNKTKLKGDTIDAHYPYAERLDNGWSKQSPKGMVKPTVEFIKKRLRQIMRK